MFDFERQKAILLCVVDQLHQRHELSETVSEDYYEPGMMEYLEESDGYYNECDGQLLIRFEVKGTRYEGRTEQIEQIKRGDLVRMERDVGNPYNHNNFRLLTEKGRDVGNVPAELCNAIAPLYDAGKFCIKRVHVTHVEPISKRSRYAQKAILFVELDAKLNE